LPVSWTAGIECEAGAGLNLALLSDPKRPRGGLAIAAAIERDPLPTREQ
jgi:hypothetical protein